jgi:hypothetical protein
MAKEKPERRKGLVCSTFTLGLTQPASGPPKGGRFTLEVTDKAGDPYVFVAQPVKDDAALVARLLRRIASQNGEAGWTFDADFYPSKGSGVIVG